MELICGPLFIRPNVRAPGASTPGHTHHFAHVTFARRGWFLLRTTKPDGTEALTQIAAPEFAEVLRLRLKYEPEQVLRPVRMADRWDAAITDDSGAVVRRARPRFELRWIAQGEPVPEGGEEIVFSATRWFELIEAENEHELINLSGDSEAVFDCTFPHRDWTGKLSENYQGWHYAYDAGIPDDQQIWPPGEAAPALQHGV